jgi:transcriptional regulator with XRE-family HTH domain
MTTRDDPAARARRRMDRAMAELLADLRATRISLGLSQDHVAAAAGMSRQFLGRLERGDLDRIPPPDVAAVAAVLGLDLRLGSFPAGDPVRDNVQLRLLEAFRARIHPSIAWRTEVPLPAVGDRRAWDAVAIADREWTGIEGISRFGAADATMRRVNLKLRDDARVHRAVMVVSDTARNRDSLRLALATVRPDFPLQTREVLDALGHGAAPRLSGVVLLRVPRRS